GAKYCRHKKTASLSQQRQHLDPHHTRPLLRRSQRFFAAREARSFGWAGTSIRSPRAMIGGRLVVPSADSAPPYYRYNWPERQVYFSAFHISPDRVLDYLEGFHRYRPMVLMDMPIHTIPSRE